MNEKLLNELLLNQARTLAPVSLGSGVTRTWIERTDAGAESIATDPDEIGMAETYNYWVSYAAEGRQTVRVLCHLVPVSDIWHLYPSVSYVEVEIDALAAAEVPKLF